MLLQRRCIAGASSATHRIAIVVSQAMKTSSSASRLPSLDSHTLSKQFEHAPPTEQPKHAPPVHTKHSPPPCTTYGTCTTGTTNTPPPQCTRYATCPAGATHSPSPQSSTYGTCTTFGTCTTGTTNTPSPPRSTYATAPPVRHTLSTATRDSHHAAASLPPARNAGA